MCRRLVFEAFLLGMVALAGHAAEPLAYWPFDGNLDDVIASADGTFFGGVLDYVPGKIGRAILFDGVDDHVQAMVNNLDAYTISAWVMPQRAGAVSIVVRTSASGTTTHWSHQMRITASGVFEHYLWDGTARNVVGTIPVEAGSWHFVAIAAGNNGPVQLYVNGQEDGIATTVGTMWAEGDRFDIGSNSGGDMQWFQGIIDDVRIYDEVLSAEEIEHVMQSGLMTSYEPSPEDGAADVVRDVTLEWLPGRSAAAHDVYVGAVFDDVNDASRAEPMGVLLSQEQTGAAYDPGRLNFGQVYYWRVDEVNAAPDNTIFKGNVWSFTVEPFAYAVENVLATSNTVSTEGQGPERIVDGSGLNAEDQHSTGTGDMWAGTPNPDEPSYLLFEFDRVYKLYEMLIWNYNMQFEMFLGYGVKEATVEYSEDGANWSVLGDVELAQSPGTETYTYGTPVAFDGVAARYVRLTIVSAFSPTASLYGLSEIRFMYIPVVAREPQPADGAVAVSVDAALTWRAGREAALHEVYLGTDPNTLPLVGTPTKAEYTPTGGFHLGTTTFWRIVEVNDAQTVPAWAGDLWSFSTQEYLLVDDFEAYVDEPGDGDVIWEIWIDGLVEYGGDPANGGSTVGHAVSPFAERTMVHSGSQSMPLYFDNPSASAISEADRTLTLPQDWTAYGIQTLSLWFQGAAGNTGNLYVKINNTRIAYDGDTGDIATALWQPWIIDLATVGADLSSVTTLTIGVEGTGSGVIYIDDIRLYGKTAEYITPVEPDGASLLVHYTFEGNVLDSSGNGIDGQANGDPIYGAGVDGQALQFDGVDDYVDVMLDVPENGSATAFWFKTTNPDCGLYAVVQNPLGAGGHDRHLYLANGRVGVRIYSGGVIVAAVDVADGQWHHLAHTYGDAIGGQRLYLDGSLQAQGTKAQSDFDWQERVHLGWSVDAVEPYLEGMLDDVRIYDRVLSSAEIAWLAGERVPVLEPF